MGRSARNTPPLKVQAPHTKGGGSFPTEDLPCSPERHVYEAQTGQGMLWAPSMFQAARGEQSGTVEWRPFIDLWWEEAARAAFANSAVEQFHYIAKKLKAATGTWWHAGAKLQAGQGQQLLLWAPQDSHVLL